MQTRTSSMPTPRLNRLHFASGLLLALMLYGGLLASTFMMNGSFSVFPYQADATLMSFMGWMAVFFATIAPSLIGAWLVTIAFPRWLPRLFGSDSVFGVFGTALVIIFVLAWNQPISATLLVR